MYAHVWGNPVVGTGFNFLRSALLRVSAVAGKRGIYRRLLAAVLLVPVLAGFGALRPTPAPAASGMDLHGLHVDGNRLANGSGQTVQIHGVNRSGTEYACIQGWGFFDGPSDAASVEAIASWNANAVRIPLNAQCWLGVNTIAEFGGGNYQQAIGEYVDVITSQGLVAILDLHWSAPGGEVANDQQPMPDRDHSVTFWREVAGMFGGNDLVIFDLFSEPYPHGNSGTDEAWRCWRDGGSCAGISYEVAGMRELVDAVRETGAPNVIMLSGIQYAAGLSRWLEYRPVDPLNNTVASWHIYPISWHAGDDKYWNSVVAGLMEHVPLIAGEIGQLDCGSEFLTKTLNWLDARGGSYNAWVWTAWGGCEPLIRDYAGTPTAYGAVYRDHLIGLETPDTPAEPVDTTAPQVSASPAGGVYDGPRAVTLAADEPATIYYTTDGGEPTPDSQQYSGPVQVASSMTLRFMAVDAAGNRSATVSETYEIQVSQAPPAPEGLGAWALRYSPSVLLWWTYPSDATTTFIVERADNPAFDQGVVRWTRQTRSYVHLDWTARRGATYYYRVIAVDSGAQSAPSNVVTVTAR